jgi:hypothetical protein
MKEEQDNSYKLTGPSGVSRIAPERPLPRGETAAEAEEICDNGKKRAP